MNDSPDRRPEPEIIPPGTPLPRDRGLWATADIGGTHYVQTWRIGPVSLVLLTLGVGAVAVLAFLFLLSAAFIGFVTVGVLTVAAIIAGILRGPPRPLR